MFEHSDWIGIKEDIGEQAPVFIKTFSVEKCIKKATMSITAIGAYIAKINGVRVGDFILAPGCTSFKSRMQYQTYDVTELLHNENELSVTVGKGWHKGRISANDKEIHEKPYALLLELLITYENGEIERIVSDDKFRARTGNILCSDLYDGESYDGQLTENEYRRLTVTPLTLSKENLIPQEGESIKEQEQIMPRKMITTPKGETVIDFGQNFAGYVKVSLTAKRGDRIKLSFAEILDAQGNFYRENYRSARAEYEYICHDGKQEYKPHFTFYGFRYVRVEEFPGEISLSNFTGIAVYSDIKRRGHIVSGNGKLNKLYENVLWSQRSNFIDIPTDCPQRDERMGWTGDAQVFAKTAAYNYDVLKFFRKWLADVRAEQRKDGSVPDTVPNFWRLTGNSTAWGDVICIVPWELYLQYGDKEILAENFEAMKHWIDYMTADTTRQYLWTCEESEKGLWKKHYGDWLALDAPYGSYKGATDDDVIASAFYYHSCSILVRAGKVLGRDVAAYETLAENISKTFQKEFPEKKTQTDCVLALFFDLISKEKKQACADQLARMIRENDGCLKTGFVGTPYVLYALSENGYTNLAYDLLLNEKNPSWLYEVNHGATTIWEHWDGINDEGKVWSSDMNSYNHYAYGSVMDWVYSYAAGIRTDEEHPGFLEAVITPHPDPRLGFLEVTLDTSYGKIRSKWTYLEDGIRYEITAPVKAQILIEEKKYTVEAGCYMFEKNGKG